MSQVNRDRTYDWKHPPGPQKFDGIEFRRGHQGCFASEYGADRMVEDWKKRGYYTRKELMFTPRGTAVWIVWRSVKKRKGA